ncbi:hypothetical protein COCCADRAFT_110828 [Bipolaris zeicola 26-R-13]|uniref:Uncharacterized protein n=1 Tax=Cochliobolus carbonum (strain 26-R-13) TaxID=930089 RepID=W6XQA9_COCC2|nr:uncharacterized protein COCCADRAFT_110828 [Bipolaris zeicola 26-R-13]EUC27773.1 hypothetical protein COCCADRAFT_110828 [Bipolaris zeicola 26-R-13]
MHQRQSHQQGRSLSASAAQVRLPTSDSGRVGASSIAPRQVQGCTGYRYLNLTKVTTFIVQASGILVADVRQQGHHLCLAISFSKHRPPPNCGRIMPIQSR